MESPGDRLPAAALGRKISVKSVAGGFGFGLVAADQLVRPRDGCMRLSQDL